jgi:hypothetical protein
MATAEFEMQNYQARTVAAERALHKRDQRLCRRPGTVPEDSPGQLPRPAPQADSLGQFGVDFGGHAGHELVNRAFFGDSQQFIAQRIGEIALQFQLRGEPVGSFAFLAGVANHRDFNLGDRNVLAARVPKHREDLAACESSVVEIMRVRPKIGAAFVDRNVRSKPVVLCLMTYQHFTRHSTGLIGPRNHDRRRNWHA